jgi:hypothetical protein
MRQHLTDPAAIEAEIARIRSLPRDALRRRWRAMFGRTPPAALSKDLLGRMMACRLQEQALGSLDRESLRFLEGLARHGGSPRRQLKPGTMLVRDYHGRRHTVTVALDGFNWQGTTYPSLSAIARAITGTAWSGPRFFALARGNGTPPAHGPNKTWARAGRNGPATGSLKIQKSICSDSIVSNSDSTASFWRLFQRHRPISVIQRFNLAVMHNSVSAAVC